MSRRAQEEAGIYQQLAKDSLRCCKRCQLLGWSERELLTMLQRMQR